MDEPDFITMKIPDRVAISMCSDSRRIEEMPVSGDKPLFFPWNKKGKYKAFVGRLRGFARQVGVREAKNLVAVAERRAFTLHKVKHGAYEGVAVWRTK